MREHPRLFAGLFIGSILALVVMTGAGGCMRTVDPLNPQKTITPQQLAQQSIAQQQTFDQQAANLQQQRQSILDDYQAQAQALTAKYQQAATKLTGDTAAYNAAVTAYNQKLQAAAQDLQAQADRNAKLIELGGNVIQAAGTGTFGPAAALGTTLLGALGGGLIGVWRDSASKSAALVVKNQQIAQLQAPAAIPSPDPAAGTNTAAAMAGPALVQAGPAALPKAA